MSTTVLSRRHLVTAIRPTTVLSLIGLVLSAFVLAVALNLSATLFSILLVAGFSIYGLYSLTISDYAGWFSTVCFFCGAESILRHGLPIAYMFFFFYLILSGVVFAFGRSSTQTFGIFTATGLIFLLAVFHFVHLDFQELRYGIGKWGVIWLGLFFGMWISQSLALNVYFYRCTWFYMLGACVVLFSFLLSPQYFAGRYWPAFDGTGPVAASTGLLVLILSHHLNFRQWISAKNILVGGLIIVGLVGLVMLGSRGTFLGLAVALVAFVFTIAGFWNKILIGVCGVLMILVIRYIDQSSIGNMVLSTRVEEAFEEDTREGRQFINSAVLLSFQEDPIVGKGTGSWRHYNNKYIAAVFDRRYPKNVMMTDAHNTVLHLLFEHGIVGAVIFLAAIFALVRRGYSLMKHTNVFILPLILYSVALGLSTMHKQASMFLPFFLTVAFLYLKPRK